MKKATIRRLADMVGSEHVSTDSIALENYSSDGTKMVHKPDAVVRPRTSEEISQILRLANEERFPVIPRGAGTGMTGGALPVQGGLVVSMERLNRILEIDPDNFVANVEPGVITGEFQKEVEPVWPYPPLAEMWPNVRAG